MLELIMPPIVGVAIGFMISMPGPEENMIGSSESTSAPGTYYEYIKLFGLIDCVDISFPPSNY
jgi:hypothetical protein